MQLSSKLFSLVTSSTLLVSTLTLAVGRDEVINTPEESQTTISVELAISENFVQQEVFAEMTGGPADPAAIDWKDLESLPQTPWSFFESNFFYIDRLISCTMDILGSGYGSKDGVRFAGNVLDAAVNFDQHKAALSSLISQCQTFKSIQQRDSLSQQTIMGVITRSEMEKGTRALLSGFANPSIKCSVFGFSLQASLLASVGFKTDLGICRDTFGRRWIEVRPGLGLGYGMGFHVGLYKGSKERSYSSFPVSVSGSSETTLGFIADLQWQGDSGVASTNRFGLGLGGGWISMNSAEFNLEILPLTSSYAPLRDVLYGMKDKAI